MPAARHANRSAARGISLIEALVAMAVMGFGMLGVLGMQASLRGNADEARQRAEAVRLGQEEIERWRGYAALDDPDATQLDYVGLNSELLDATVGTNTSYTLRRTVAEPPAPSGVTPHAYKVLRVEVTWADRAGDSRSVRFSSNLAGVPPELAAVSVVAGGEPTASPRGRKVSIPLPAVNLGDGRSAFLPPLAGGGVAWVFSHTTGLISTCTTTALSTDALNLGNISACGSFNAQLVSGYVRFSTSAAPTALLAETPPDSAVLVDVQVRRTAPSVLTTPCAVELAPGSSPGYAVYFCAVPVEVSPSVSPWSGRVFVASVSGSPLPVTSGFNPADRRICRYTDSRFANNNPLTDNVGMTNQDHPLDYLNVTEALTNQNFLVIAAGDGSSAYTCPADAPATPVTAAIVTTFSHPAPP